MLNNTLMRSQKNEVLETIKETALDPNSFRWSDEESRFFNEKSAGVVGAGFPPTVSKLSYDNSPYYFLFDFSIQDHYSYYSPGKDKLHEKQHPGAWDGQLNCVGNWLSYLEREMAQPDLWDDLANQKISYDEELSPDTTNEPFSESQGIQIAEGIEDIRNYLLGEFQDDSDAKGLINEKLDYLIDGSKRQGRKDWFHTCMGLFMTIAIALAMSPDQTKNMWALLKNAVSGILRLLPV